MSKKAVLLLSFTLIISSTFFTDFANAQTNVNGEITVDTTWSASQSPIVFTGPVVVAEDAALTIEEGVTVDMSSFSLTVKGTLMVKGNSSNRIVFASESTTLSPTTNAQIIFDPTSTDFEPSHGTGCNIENAEINVSLTINGSSPNIAGCKILGGITIIEASPTITGNEISEGGAVYAISVENESSPTISTNKITGKAIGICFNIPDNGYTNNQYNANVENNTIIDCVTGVEVGNCQGTILLYGNLISGATDAIKVNNSAAAVSIQYNLIMNNTRGIFVGNQIAVQDNTIYNNTVGIYYATDSQSIISYNNIMNNTQYNFETTSSSSLEATYNFWGTQDIPTINSTIYDQNNNDTLGEVKYLPALDSPYSGAPIIPDIDMNPTTTPSPTITASPTGSPNQTVQPTPTNNTTPTPTQVEQGTFGTIEIGIIAALSIVIAITLIIGFKKGKKCETQKTKT